MVLEIVVGTIDTAQTPNRIVYDLGGKPVYPLRNTGLEIGRLYSSHERWSLDG